MNPVKDVLSKQADSSWIQSRQSPAHLHNKLLSTRVLQVANDVYVSNFNEILTLIGPTYLHFSELFCS